MSARHRLPNRRAHELIEFGHGGFRYTAGIGRFADGQLAEIFLTAAKTGTPLDAAARDAAIVASLALQHGTPVEIIQHALTRNSDGSASGPVGALLDLLADGGAA
jgi:ribonucleoside-diphosphate reductase alpha chain